MANFYCVKIPDEPDLTLLEGDTLTLHNVIGDRVTLTGGQLLWSAGRWPENWFAVSRQGWILGIDNVFGIDLWKVTVG